MKVDAMLEIFADTPPAILFAGAIILFIIGSAAQMAGAQGVAGTLYVFGLLCLLVGTVLQIRWLENRR